MDRGTVRRLLRPSLAPAFGILLAIAVAYVPVYGAGWVWDDREHILANENLRSLEGLGRIWLEPRSLPQYYPLVHTSFWIEYQLWGRRPLGYHVVNVVLHGVTGVLVYGLLRQLAVPGALLAAFVFALHPVHVESVAWVTERKNVLSGVFYMLAALALVQLFGLAGEEHDGGRKRLSGRGLWWLALMLFLAALLSKTVTATLPAAFLLLLWWRGRRIGRSELVSLLPFFALGVALGLNTVRLEREHVGALGPEWSLSVAQHLVVAGRVPWFYLSKLVWPSELSFVYRRWVVDGSDPWQLAPFVCGTVVLVLLFAFRAVLGRGPFVAMAYFVGTLVPALAFFSVYPMRFSFVADHFQYLASLGPITLAAAGLSALRERTRTLQCRTVAVAMAVIPAVLGATTVVRARSFHDAAGLWRDTLARNPECWLCLNNLGAELARDGRASEALLPLSAAVRLKPDYAEARVNLGFALATTGRLEEAVREYDAAVSLGEAAQALAAQYNRGLALGRLGRLAEALASFQEAGRLAPDDPHVSADLGRALALLGRFGEAVEPLRRGLRAHPADAEFRREVAFVLNAAGRHQEALSYARAAVAMSPDSIGARLELARTLSTVGDAAGAFRETEEILHRAPASPEALALRESLVRQGRR